MWIWGITWLGIIGLLIGALIIGLVWDRQWIAAWREGGKAVAPARASTGPRPLKPRTPEDCPACRGKGFQDGIGEAETGVGSCAITPYEQVKSRRGRKKHQSTAGYACPNSDCVY